MRLRASATRQHRYEDEKVSALRAREDCSILGKRDRGGLRDGVAIGVRISFRSNLYIDVGGGNTITKNAR
jgi:hypothetical protein